MGKEILEYPNPNSKSSRPEGSQTFQMYNQDVKAGERGLWRILSQWMIIWKATVVYKRL